MPTAKPDELCLLPWTYRVEGKNQLLQAVLQCPHTVFSKHTHRIIPTPHTNETHLVCEVEQFLPSTEIQTDPTLARNTRSFQGPRHPSQSMWSGQRYCSSLISFQFDILTDESCWLSLGEMHKESISLGH